MFETETPFAALVSRTTGIKKRASGIVSARQAVGEIGKGDIIVGVTKASFSMLDLIEAVLDRTGPAAVDVSTWTMGVYDADVLWRFASSGRITATRFLVDPSMFGRRAELSDAFVAAFGGDALRALDNHAKFTLLGNAEWQVTITSSMNLNRNRRLENFTLFEDPGVYAFHKRIVDDVFRQVIPTWKGKRRTQEEFEALTFSGQINDASAVW